MNQSELMNQLDKIVNPIKTPLYSFRYRKLDDNGNVIDSGTETTTDKDLFKKMGKDKINAGYQINLGTCNKNTK